VFDVGGFRKRPLTCSRYEKSPMEDYGRSPAINVLPAVRAAQEIKRDLVTAIEFMARPALGAHDDMLDQLIMFSPGGISYGAIDDRGNALIKRLWDDPDIQPGLQLLADTQAVIKRAFFEDLYIVRQELKSHIGVRAADPRPAARDPARAVEAAGNRVVHAADRARARPDGRNGHARRHADGSPRGGRAVPGRL
jgi:hypothetical protein